MGITTNRACMFLAVSHATLEVLSQLLDLMPCMPACMFCKSSDVAYLIPRLSPLQTRPIPMMATTISRRPCPCSEGGSVAVSEEQQALEEKGDGR